jgi:dienelactone hydrolase
VVVVAAVLLPAISRAQEASLKEIALPAPIGEHAIGVRTTLLPDRSRIDTLAATPGPRPILVRVWYPADSSDGATRPYMVPEVAGPWHGTLPAPNGFEARIVTNAVDDAPLATARQRWPVLLFSHGRSFPVENYQILLEQLASQGWVVAAISHPYEEAATRLPDGRVLPFSGPTWAHDSLRGEVLQGVIDELVLDAGVVLDWLERAVALPSDPFHDRLDLVRGVGYLGHSLGGAAAAWTMQRDPRVTAAFSWEGQVYRDADRPMQSRGPLLYMIGSANRADLLGKHFRPGSNGSVYELVLNGGWHISVGDILYIYQRYAPRDWLRRHRREIDPLRANRITGDYADEFFGHYLLDRPLELLWPDAPADLERGTTWNYPEVELRVYPP